MRITHETLLSCNGCNVSKTFTAIVSIKLMGNSATTPTPAGYQCSQCGAVVDLSRMVKAEEMRRLRIELDEKHKQYSEAQEPVEKK